MFMSQMAAQRSGPRSEYGGRARSELVVARRYLAHGFLDTAMRIFGRNARQVSADEWTLLVSRLLEGGRIAEAVDVCQKADLPLPRRELLALGDCHLRRRNLDAAIHYYDLADADHQRWVQLVSVLTCFPGRELRARAVAERYLVARERSAPSFPLAASA
jgi:hypothetical protein